MDEKKICIIRCVNDSSMQKETMRYLKALNVPVGMKVEFIDVEGAPFMTAGYQFAMERSDAKYKIYLHQDIFCIKKDMLEQFLHIFQVDSAIGMIGLAGSYHIPPSTCWWDAPDKIGSIFHSVTPKKLLRDIYGETENSYRDDLAAMDGIIFATQYDLPWRTDLFDGWHFYDISQCQEFRRQGYKLAIPRQEDAWVIHETKHVATDETYEIYRRRFIEEYCS